MDSLEAGTDKNRGNKAWNATRFLAEWHRVRVTHTGKANMLSQQKKLGVLPVMVAHRV